MEDYDRLVTVPKFVEPKKEDFEAKANLNSWLLDGRDQLLTRYSNETEIYWNDPLKEAGNNCRRLAYGGEREKSRDKVCIRNLGEFFN